jgi:hypothetical protein
VPRVQRSAAARAGDQAAHGARHRGAEGSPHAHEVLKADVAIQYLEKRGGYEQAIAMLKAAKPDKSPLTFKGSSGVGKNRDDFGKIINGMLDGMTRGSACERARVRQRPGGLLRPAPHPQGAPGGVRARRHHGARQLLRGGRLRLRRGKQGIFATFSAFLEMCISEITMARLNFSNVLAHFSHSGVDDMADNTCHFGINSMFADGGVKPGHGEDTTRLYFPSDQHQFAACVKRIFNDPGLRFVFSTRAPVPDILDEDGKPLYAGQAVRAGQGRPWCARPRPAAATSSPWARPCTRARCRDHACRRRASRSGSSTSRRSTSSMRR